MRTVDELKEDFHVYLSEIENCQKEGCNWALLHILLALPDVCASLERDPNAPPDNKSGGDRYINWCGRFFPTDSDVTPGDRYQMRNALFHQGSSTADNRTRVESKQTQYVHFSYLNPGDFDVTMHYTTGENPRVLNVHPTQLAEETRQALFNWFDDLQRNAECMSLVKSNLHRLVRRQPKRTQIDRNVKGGRTISREVAGETTSSSRNTF